MTGARHDKDAVRAAVRLEELIPSLLGQQAIKASASEVAVRCPFHEDGSPSLHVNPQKQLWTCRACDQQGGDVFAFLMKFEGITFGAALARAAEHAGMSHVTAASQRPAPAKIEATYDYRDEQGQLLYQVVRREGKGFTQRRPNPDPNGSPWLWNLPESQRRVVYGLDRLVKSKPQSVVIVEGEKDADALTAIGVPATCNPQGAGKWRPEFADQLKGAGVSRVLCLPDNDAPGIAHRDQVAASCHAAGLTVKVVDPLPGVPAKGDVSDYLAMPHTKAELFDVFKSARDYKPELGADIGIVAVRMSEVSAKPIEWIWPRRIARGMFTLMAGNPGIGKSFLTADIAGRISRGQEWPDGGRAPLGKTIFLAAEDALEYTFRPRLDAIGADTDNVIALKAVKDASGDRPLSLQTDLELLALFIQRERPVLVVIDPINSYIGNKDSYKDQEVRSVLMPLVKLAEDTGVAILAISHCSKDSSRQAMFRVLGSIAYTAVARFGLMVAKDPNDPARRLVMASKANICREAPTLAFGITGSVGPRDEDDTNARLTWELAPVEGIDVDAVMSYSPVSGATSGDHSEVAEAANWLSDLLSGQSLTALEIFKAGKAEGYSDATVRRAKKLAGVTSKKSAVKGPWLWRLESPRCSVPTTASDVSTLGADDAVSPTESNTFPKMLTPPNQLSALDSGSSSAAPEEWGEV